MNLWGKILGPKENASSLDLLHVDQIRGGVLDPWKGGLGTKGAKHLDCLELLILCGLTNNLHCAVSRWVANELEGDALRHTKFLVLAITNWV